MFEPKAMDFITTNDKHILVYEYLDFPITAKLACDIVIGINPQMDEIAFLVPDENGVYIDITNGFCQKPTLGVAEINLQISNLLSYSFKGLISTSKNYIDKKENYHTLVTQFIRKG